MTADLPVEHELIDGEWYRNNQYSRRQYSKQRGGFVNKDNGQVYPVGQWMPAFRLAEVAEYRLKPDEPTGLGAVVRDGYGARWVRIGDRKRPWVHCSAPVNPCGWDEIQPIEIVLSEGVTR